MRISILGSLSDGAAQSQVDAYVEELTRVRHEGFRSM